MTQIDLKHSREADLIREIDLLIAKVVSDMASTQERARLSELMELRSKLMHPVLNTGFDDRRRRWG